MDARFLNKVVEDDHESPPIINELLQDYENVKYFSKLDLTNGYWQVQLDSDSRPYTAFLFESSMYVFTWVPFGLKNAGSAFIRALKNALADGSVTLRKALKNYIDDLLIGTETIEEHILLLQELFELLNKYNFTINFHKCEFFKLEVSFLGFIISSKGVMANPERIKIIQNFIFYINFFI